MPTALRVAGLRIVIYPNDHAPPHVHVLADDCEAIFDLHCPKGPPTLRINYRFSKQGVARTRSVVASQVAMLCRRWFEVHGQG